jgi:carboxyl-terminal processing protease
VKKLLFLGIIICAQPTLTTDEPTKPYEQAVYEWTRTFAQVLQLVGEKHYSAQNIDKCMTSAIGAFLDCLDPHSGFLDPETYKMILETTTGEFFGIGVVIDNTRRTKDRHLTVVETLPQGPAEQAGVKAGDKIVEVGGTTLEGMPTEKITVLLKGPRDSKVTIKVIRDGFPDLMTFDIKRDVIREQNTLSFTIPGHNIAYLSLTQFSENVAKSLEALLQRAHKDNCRGIIIDLRNNSGGLLDVAVDILGLFVPKGSVVVTTKNRQNAVTESYVTQRDPVTKQLTIPIIILVNNFTASAAEILAGCLKIYSERAGTEPTKKGGHPSLPVFVLGTKTFGKGSVQEVIPVSNDSAIKLTTSLYYLPNDTTIQGTGIQPDFVIERLFPASEQMSWISKVYGSEGALSNAIKPADAKKEDTTKKKDEKKKNEKSWVDKTREALEQDNQFKTALSMINLYQLGRASAPHEVATRDKAVAFLSRQCSCDKIVLEEVKN